jgi:hypothetical protein
MPYVSPHGVVTATAPPRKKTQPVESPETADDENDDGQQIQHVPSIDLGEVLEGRDADPEVAEEMGHWGGFEEKHHELADEKEYELEEALAPGDDVLDEGPEGGGKGDRAETGDATSTIASAGTVSTAVQDAARGKANLKAAEVVAKG